jgi:hypothetical protein
LKPLLNSIYFLIVYLCIFFNLDRFNTPNAEKIFGFHPFIYVLFPILILFFLTVPILRRRNIFLLYGFGCIAYGITFVLSGISLPVQNNNLYSSIIEVFLLLIAIYLVNQFNQHIINQQELVEKVILPRYQYRVYTDRDMARGIIEHEFIRNRRNNHPITAVIFENNPENVKDDTITKQTMQEIQSTLQGQYIANKIMQIIENETRLTDLVVEWEKQKRFVVILPETTVESSTTLINRLQKAVKDNLGISIPYGIASFPNDGLTFNAVLEKAEEHITAPEDLVLLFTENGGKTTDSPKM